MEMKNIDEASEYCGIPGEVIIYYIRQEWITPKDQRTLILDEEDVARVRLIWELLSDFGVNEESVPVILHLLDQLNRIHLELSRFKTH